MPTATIKCPNCGGSLRFDPARQKSKCEFCLSEFTAQDLAAVQKAIEQKAARKREEARAAAAAAETAATPEEAEAARLAAAAKAETADALADEAAELAAAVDAGAQTDAGAGSYVDAGAGAGADADADADAGSYAYKGYICDSCGAEVVTDATTSATFCYYCHNPILLTDRLTGELRPTRIIPFTFDRAKAEAAFLKWSRSRRFVPRTFYSASQLEKITGIYIPYWMASYKADIDISGTGTHLKVWNTGQTEYTETSVFGIERKGTIDLDHVHEIAVRKFDHNLINSISPYDEREAKPFSMSYLGGFFAEKFDIPRTEAEPAIENQARQYTNALVQDVIGGYNKVELVRNQVDMRIKGWDYALMPAWMLTYRYHGKTFIYAVNGQTGRSFGELPVDTGKLALTSGIIALVTMILILLGGYFIW